MRIRRLFAAKIQEADCLATARQSLSRRDRRIGYLKRRLRQTREEAARVIGQKNEIISGLEQALLLHAPVADMRADERIAFLEAQLEAMTALAETLQQRETGARL